MGLTFVADCSFGMRLLSTCPRGHAVAAPFSAKRPNWPDETCTHGWLVFGIAPADFADTADKGRRISDYPRHLRYLRLNVLADPSVAVSDRGRKSSG